MGFLVPKEEQHIWVSSSSSLNENYTVKKIQK